MSVQEVNARAKEDFAKAVDHLFNEFSKLRIGRASSALVEDMHIPAYGGSQALKAVASISIPDAKTISISPWDKSLTAVIEKAIRDSDLGLSPNNNGQSILLSIPPLTEERRKDLVKVVHKMAEETRITIRTKRQDAMSKFKNMEKNEEITEDEQKSAEKRLQEMVDEANKKVEEYTKQKEEDVLKV